MRFKRKTKYKKQFFVIVTYLSVISLFVYFIGRIYIYTKLSNSQGDNLFAFLLLLAEGHAILHSLGYIIGIARTKKEVQFFDKKNINAQEPQVTIMVPGRNEPLEVLELTFISLFSLDYVNKKIVFLDGSDKEYAKGNAELAKRYNIERYSPTQTPRSKAAIVNQYLKKIDSEYIVIFDADQNPMPEFLKEVVNIISNSKKIAFVQTPQLYSNLHNSSVSKAASMQQSIFFEDICEAKGTSNSMFCCGTNFIMRTNVLKEVGGFDENSVTEDFSTSIKIHSLGYDSIYHNHVRVFGMAPESLPAYLTQQFRWASGTLGAVRTIIKMLLKGNLKLKMVQLWEYLLSGTYYLAGWSFLILMLAPALYLIFNIPSYFSNPYFYLLSFLPYYILSFLTFYATMKERHYKLKDIFIGMTINYLNFPILIHASIAAILNVKLKFKITKKGDNSILSFYQLWPWILAIILNITAIIFGFFRLKEDIYAILINIFWCVYHLIIILNIFKLNSKGNITKHNILNYSKI